MYSLTYFCVNTQKSVAQERLDLWTNPEVQNHIESLLEGRTDIPIFDGYSAHGKRNGSNIDVDVFRLEMQVSKFLVALEKDQTSLDAFNKIFFTGANGKSCVEPIAPYCASYIGAPPIFDLLELEWVRSYERCVAWEWAYMWSRRRDQILAVE